MGVFKDWFAANEMAARTSWKFGKRIPNLPERDSAGLKHMSRPGFRDQDRHYLAGGTGPSEGCRSDGEVERKLTKACEKYGIHWIVDNFEPPEGMEEDNADHWQQYRQLATDRGQQLLAQFGKEYSPSMSVTQMEPPNPTNTIVYVKSGSRVHCLTPHEQVHNIGHAIWLRNPEQMAQAKQELHKAVQVLQQSGYESGQPPPSEAEVTIVLARLIDLLSFQRALVLNPGDLSSSVKTALTAFQNFDEVIFELFPAFINAGGQLNLYPRGPGKVAKFDRAAAIKPNPEVVQQKNVRPWVWEKILADRPAWDAVSKIMTGIIVKCLQQSTWAKKNGPIFPYQKLTTKP